MGRLLRPWLRFTQRGRAGGHSPIGGTGRYAARSGLYRQGHGRPDRRYRATAFRRRADFVCAYRRGAGAVCLSSRRVTRDKLKTPCTGGRLQCADVAAKCHLRRRREPLPPGRHKRLGVMMSGAIGNNLDQSSASTIEVRQLVKSFNGQRVLNGIDLSVNRGDVLAIVGPSGSGKTTLLRSINLLEEPDSGTIQVGSILIDGARPLSAQKRQIRALRQQVGFVFQSFNLFPHRTVLENIIEGPVIVKGESRAE